ncbi:TetR family transcriptional regulator [Acidocella sp.]|uniref:TetR family transcriptional regulator n=1 Tax=Acidocella sp. TaxID=50710 RepID=UPI003CFE9871
MSLGKTRDPERTRQDILRVATEEFAKHGLSGARVDAIAARTHTTKRMIYYYFESKEGLYITVLEHAYGGIRQIEANMKLDELDPQTALRRLVELNFDYHDAHPEFIRLVMIENIHNAEHVRGSEIMRRTNSPAIEILARILKRGHEAGVFKRQIEARELHMMISALAFYRVSNRATFSTLYNIDIGAPQPRERQRRYIADAILLLMTTPE